MSDANDEIRRRQAFRAADTQFVSVVPGNGIGRLKIGVSAPPDAALERRKKYLKDRIAELERENEEHKDSWNPYNMFRNSMRSESIENAKSMLSDLETGTSRGVLTQVNDGIVTAGDGVIEGVEGVAGLAKKYAQGELSVASDLLHGNVSGATDTIASGAKTVKDAAVGAYDGVVNKPWYQGARDAFATGQVGSGLGEVAPDAAGAAGAARSLAKAAARRLEIAAAEQAAKEEAELLAKARGAENNGIEKPKPPEEKPADPKDPAQAGEPVVLARGEYVETWEDFRLEGTLPVVLFRYYGALLGMDGPLGRNRTCVLDTTFSVTRNNQLVYREDEGRSIEFDRPFNLSASTNSKHRHLSLRAPWLKNLALQDRHLTRLYEQGKDKVYRLVRIEDRNGNALKIQRDAGGLIIRAEHSDGYALQFENDERGLRRSVTQTSPDIEDLLLVSYRYDAGGNMLAADCAAAFSIEYAYDDKGRLTAWRDRTRRSQTVFVYDDQNRVTRTETAGPWHGDVFEYDRANGITTYRPGGGPAFERFVFDGNENVIQEENALGEVKRFEYQDGYKTAEIDGEGARTATTYDEFGNVASFTDAEGRRTLYRWGTRGELDLVIDREGNAYRYEHDAKGNPVSAKDPNGAVTRFAWTAAGRLVRVTRPGGATEDFRYDARHRLIAFRAPNGAVTRYERDFLGRVTAVLDPLGATTRFAYDPVPGKPLGMPTRVERPDGTTIERSFDGEGQVASVTDGEGRTTRYRYGAFDLLAEVQDPKGGLLKLAYDVRGMLETVINAHGRVYAYERDLAGRVIAETDFDGRVLRYTRDKAGRVTGRDAPDGSRLVYAYDASGRLTRIVAHEPDATGRPSGTASATETFTYDPRGLLIGAANPDGEPRFERDPAGRVLSESQNHRRVRSTYDAGGRRIERTIGYAPGWTAEGRTPAGFQGLTPEDIAAGRILNPPAAAPPAAPAPDGIARYAHDPLGMLSELALGTDGMERLSFTRDPMGRETGRRSGAGFALSQQWDPLGQLTRQAVQARVGAGRPGGHPAGPAANGYARSFAYDRAYAPVEIADDLWGATRYAYDNNGQATEATHRAPRTGEAQGVAAKALLDPAPPLGSMGFGDDSIEVERFEYDVTRDIAASRTTLPGEPDGRPPVPWLSSVGGRVLAARGPAGERVLLTHDACGRVVTRRIERDGFRPRSWTYLWNAFDRLTGCTTPDGAVWRYGYDPFGRRVGKRLVSRPGGLGSAGTGTRFTWDGDVVAEAIPIGPEGALAMDRRVTWHFEPGSFRPLAREAADGTVCWMVTDHLGTPRELVSSTGELEWAASFRLWGEVRTVWRRPRAATLIAANGPVAWAGEEDTEEGFCPFRFQGQWEDGETGLNYNRHRHYEPISGQFVSADPIGLRGGARLNSYVARPTTLVDPLGLTGNCLPKASGDLDWSRVNSRGEDGLEHVMRHDADMPNRNVHSVFGDTSLDQVEGAWNTAKEQGIRPTLNSYGNWEYNISSPNAGLQGGRVGAAAGNPILNNIKVVTLPNSNAVVTAFPF